MDQNQGIPPVPVEPAQTALPSEMPGSNNVNQPKRGKAPFVVGAIIIVAVLAAWGAYTVYASPSRLWQRFTQKAVFPKVATEDYSFSYVDNGKLASSTQDNPFASMVANIKLSANGTAYINNTDLANPEMTMDMNYSFGSGNTSVSSEAKFIFKDQDFYINFGSNPFINGVFSALSPDKPVDWVKFDLKKAQELEQSVATGTPTSFDYLQQVKIYRDIENKYLLELVDQGKFIDKQTLHGQPMYHYSNTLNKDQFSAMTGELVDAMLNQMQAQGQIKPEDSANVRAIVNKVVKNFIGRMQISVLETWVGVNDYQLHKIKFSSNALSLASLISAATDPSVNQAGDAQQTADLVLGKLTFDGQFTLEEELYDFGKTTTVNPPTDSFDLIQKMQEQKAAEQQMMQQPMMQQPVPIK